MSVEIWDAIRYERPLLQGRTKPLVLECEQRNASAGADVPTLVPSPSVSPVSSLLLGASGRPLGKAPSLILPNQEDEEEEASNAQSRLFVVKGLGHPEVLEETLFKELFGNVLARAFGIETPAPALVVLSEALVRTVQPLLPPEIKLRVGYAVGCEYLNPLTPIGAEFRLTRALLPEAAQIYAFDLLTANPDRHIRNPNCAYRSDRLVAYDFESAFSFLRALWGPPAWQVSKLTFQHPHVFKAQLLRDGADWQPFVNCLEGLDEAKLGAIVKDWPHAWLSHYPRVVDYILAARDELQRWPLELEESLRVASDGAGNRR